MKRLILIICFISFSFCVQAKRTPYDSNSPSSFLTSLLFSNGIFSGSSSSSAFNSTTTSCNAPFYLICVEQ